MRMHVSITTTHPIVVAIGRACPSWSLARFFLTSVTELQVKTSHVLLQMACRREALRALVAVMLTVREYAGVGSTRKHLGRAQHDASNN